MMFLHEQNETEPILIVENLWPLSMFFKPLIFSLPREGKNFKGEPKEREGLQ